MTITDYLINFVLIGLVVLQLRSRRLTVRNAIRPVVLVAAAAVYYLRSFPTSGNDALLYAVLGGLGLILGVACGATTRVWRATDGATYAKAGIAAAAFWVIGIGSRLAFEEFATHGGGRDIVSFSIAHDITGQAAWVGALVLMALAEVLARLVTIRARGARARAASSDLRAPQRVTSAV